MRHSLNKFSRGNNPKKGMGIGLQEIAEKWLDEHNFSYSLEDFEKGYDENGNAIIEIVVDKGYLTEGEGKGEVKITFTY